MRLAITIMVIAFVASIACPCFAGNNPLGYSAIHVKAHNAKQSCLALPPISTSADIVTTYAGSSFDAFPVFYDLTEYKGVEYGMTWPAWSFSGAFTNCADLVIGGIAWPGDEVAHAWNACQAGPVVIPGWVWLYADGPGLICLSAPVALGNVSVLDCNRKLDASLYSYCAGVYGATGEVPGATEPTTWSAIKQIFR